MQNDCCARALLCKIIVNVVSRDIQRKERKGERQGTLHKDVRQTFISFHKRDCTILGIGYNTDFVIFHWPGTKVFKFYLGTNLA